MNSLVNLALIGASGVVGKKIISIFSTEKRRFETLLQNDVT